MWVSIGQVNNARIHIRHTKKEGVESGIAGRSEERQLKEYVTSNYDHQVQEVIATNESIGNVVVYLKLNKWSLVK